MLLRYRAHSVFMAALATSLVAFATVHASVVEIEVAETDTLVIGTDEVELHVLEFSADGNPTEYDYCREDAGYVRVYAYRQPGSPIYYFDPPRILVKQSGLFIGESWSNSVAGGVDAQVVGFSAHVVPAGVFPAWEIQAEGSGPSMWFSEDVGLLGTDNFGGTGPALALASYSVVGGLGCLPLAVGNHWTYDLDETSSHVEAPFATITVDGYKGDWAGINPALGDPLGDDPSPYTGADIENVYVARDSVFLYLMAEFHDGPANPTWGGISLFAYQFHIRVHQNDNTSIGVWYDGFSWTLAGNNLDVTGGSAAGGAVVEARLPLASLGLSEPPEIAEFGMQVGTGDEDYDDTSSISVGLSGTTGVSPESWSRVKARYR